MTKNKEVKFLSNREIQGIEFIQILSKLNKPDALNRSILNNSLHRVSFIKNKKDETYGLTIRNGRIIKDFT